MDAVAFSWTDESDVSRRLGIADARGIVTPPGTDQRACDTCWAVALSQVISDRFRIATKDRTFAQLSPMQLLTESQRFCEGGSFEEGIEMMQRQGVASLCCFPYNTKDLRARKASQPTCATKTPEARARFASLFATPGQYDRLNLPWSCDSVDPQRRFRTRRGSGAELSTRSIDQARINETAMRIRRELYVHGPVVCRISVPVDLFDPTHRTRGLGDRYPFSATAGVFMSITGEKSLYYKAASSKSSGCCRGDGPCDSVFGHGLAIVGWGVSRFVDVPQRGADAVRISKLKGPEAEALAREVERARNASSRGGLLRLEARDYAGIVRRAGLPPQLATSLAETQEVPYWVLRNSWGTYANARDGFYSRGLIKVAFCRSYRIAGRQRRVNLTLGIEHRHHCGHVTRTTFGSRVTVCGGAMDPGIPRLS